MKTKEFDDIINEALKSESKKYIMEQSNYDPTNRSDREIPELPKDIENVVRKLKGSLVGFAEWITSVETINDGIKITIDNVPSKKFHGWIGAHGNFSMGISMFRNALIRSNEGVIEGDIDVDIDVSSNGEEWDKNARNTPNLMDLVIKITKAAPELGDENESDMDEQRDNGELTNTFGQAMYEDESKEPKRIKDTNPQAGDDKDVILGDEVKEEEVDEQWQAAAGAVAGEMIGAEALAGSGVAPVVQRAVSGAIGNKITDALGGNEEVDEQEQTAAGAMAAEENMNESKKKTITLSEGEMGKLLAKIIKEAVESPNITIPANGIPGLDVTKKAQKDSGKENDNALKAVEKKIKDYLGGIEGTDNPEGQNPEGQGEEKVSVPASDSQEEEIEMNRGRNPADLTYDSEPGETFKERAKLSLIGAAEMGNSHEYANVVNPDSKVGENIAKTAEKRKEIRKDEPIYDKEAVPVKKDDKKTVRPAVDEPAVASDIKRMKQMSGYKEKTQ